MSDTLPYYNFQDDEPPTLPLGPPPSGTATPSRDSQNMSRNYGTFQTGIPAPGDTQGAAPFNHFDEARWAVGAVLQLPRYTEAGSDSEDSDDDEDDEKCLICFRRKATISFTSCRHQMCVSCTKQCWWTAIAHELHWPREMPCPFCRGAITAVIEAGRPPAMLVRWIRRRSSAARMRFIVERMTDVSQARGAWWYREYQLEHQPGVINLGNLNVFLLVVFIMTILFSFMILTTYR